jgi:hypothetical protein
MKVVSFTDFSERVESHHTIDGARPIFAPVI